MEVNDEKKGNLISVDGAKIEKVGGRIILALCAIVLIWWFARSGGFQMFGGGDKITADSVNKRVNVLVVRMDTADSKIKACQSCCANNNGKFDEVIQRFDKLISVLASNCYKTKAQPIVRTEAPVQREVVATAPRVKKARVKAPIPQAAVSATAPAPIVQMSTVQPIVQSSSASKTLTQEEINEINRRYVHNNTINKKKTYVSSGEDGEDEGEAEVEPEPEPEPEGE
ncbi:MAG: hypothetical protein WCK37_05265 [Candidatus Falkowbacteria bacterium]